MAATYDELKAEIQSWLDRTDASLIAAIPDLIATAEDYLEQAVSHWRRESVQSLPVDPSGEYDLPADFFGVVLLSKAGSNIELVYNQKLERLSETVATNWLLAESSTLYRYTSLAQAESWLKNDPRIAIWSAMSESALKMLNAQGHGQPISDSREGKRPFRSGMLAGADSWIDYVSPAESIDILRSGRTIAENQGRQVYSLWAGKLRVVPIS